MMAGILGLSPLLVRAGIKERLPNLFLLYSAGWRLGLIVNGIRAD